MKRSILLIIALAILLLPVMAKAYETNPTGLDEALTAEGIDHDLSKYKETDDQVVVYLFRRDGCTYCHRALEFLYSIIPDYGKYFKVVSYEIAGANSEGNRSLFQDVGKFLDEDTRGVPFMVIGDKVFMGYAEDYNEDIKTVIMDEYNSDEKYDVLEQMAKAKDKTEVTCKSPVGNTIIIIAFNFLFNILSTVAIILYLMNKGSKKVNKN